jgi:hypothetical protein
MEKKLKILLKEITISTLLIIPLFLILETKLTIILYIITVLIQSYIIYKEKVGKEIIIAALFALIVTSYHTYIYTTTNLMIGKINLFPLISWTAGLVILRETYKRTNIKYKYLIFTIIYITILILIESIGYHILGIRLDSNYSGLFGLSVIHAPTELKAFYLLAGPLYLLITNDLQIK